MLDNFGRLGIPLLFFLISYHLLGSITIQLYVGILLLIVRLSCSLNAFLFAHFFPKPLVTSVRLKIESSFNTELSHKVLRVGDAGGEPVLELLLSCHLCHLILLRMVQPAVAVLAVVVVAYRVPYEPERFAQPCL